MKTVLAFAVAGLLLGCASTPDVASMPSASLCASYAAKPRLRAELRAAIDARRLMQAADWDVVSRGTLRVGMTECAMYASWGYPERQNTLTTGSGSRTQHVYGRQYVYTSAGVVTAIQH